MNITDELTIILDNLSISYTDDSKDNDLPIILIHGFPLDKSMWYQQRVALRDKFRVITYDVRGYGRSGIGRDEFTIDLFATDLLHLMNALNLSKVVLCGLSMGGYIALKAMEKFGDRIAGLILCDTQCTADTVDSKKNRIKTIEMIHSGGLELYADQVLSALFYSETMDKKSKEIIEMRTIIEHNSPEVICDTLLALAEREETCNNLHKITIPTLILVGEEDSITPIEKSELSRAAMANT
jgi:pimeloyl-ACP methyl ester carboxylesterase